MQSYDWASSPRRDHLQRGAVRWTFLIAALLVGIMAAALVVSFRQVADNKRRTQLAIWDFRTHMFAIEALEWRAIAAREVSPEVRRDAMRLHSQMMQALGAAESLSPNQPQLRRVRMYHHRYMKAIDREFALLVDGQIARALELDDQTVDPAFETLNQAAATASNSDNAMAEQGIATADRTAVVATLAAFVVITLLLWRFERAEESTRISELRQDALRESEERFRSLVQNSSNVVMIVEPDGILRYVSAGAHRVLGLAPEEMSHRNLFEFVHKDDVPKVGSFLLECMSETNAKATLEFRFARGEGGWIDLEAVGNNSLADPSIGGIVMNCRDVTDRKKLEEQLRSLSLRDDLTGLHNRRGFFTFAEQMIIIAARGDREIFLLFADLDGMKLINDTYGHAAGDEALRDAAHILRSSFRRADVVARMGGDEFAVFGERVADFPAHILVSRLEHDLRRHNAQRKAPFSINLSVGVIAEHATDDTSVDDLLTSADERMYTQKYRHKKRSA